MRHGAALLHVHNEIDELFVGSRAHEAEHRENDDQHVVMFLGGEQNVHTTTSNLSQKASPDL